jgi:hypothetical protein
MTATAGRDQRQKRAEHHPVEHLRDEIAPVDHAVVRNPLRCSFAAAPVVFSTLMPSVGAA